MRYKLTSGNYVVSWLGGSNFDNIDNWRWGDINHESRNGSGAYSQVKLAAKCIHDYAIKANLPSDAAEWNIQIEPYPLYDAHRGTNSNFIFYVDSKTGFNIDTYAKYEEVL